MLQEKHLKCFKEENQVAKPDPNSLKKRCTYIYIYIYIFELVHTYIYIHTHIIYMHVYVCVYVCVCIYIYLFALYGKETHTPPMCQALC